MKVILETDLTSSFALLCGIGSGGFFALQSSVVAQVIGLHRLERGIGYLELAASFGFLAGPISAGALLDAFGGTTQGAAPYRPVIVSLSYSTPGFRIYLVCGGVADHFSVPCRGHHSFSLGVYCLCTLE